MNESESLDYMQRERYESLYPGFRQFQLVMKGEEYESHTFATVRVLSAIPQQLQIFFQLAMT